MLKSLYVLSSTLVLSNALVTTSESSLASNNRASLVSTHVATSPDSLNSDMETTKPPTLPKYSKSIPFLARPKYLTGELPGDVGFDPLNFASNPELVIEYREAEIKHGRLAMLAAAGWPVSELLDGKIASTMQMSTVVDVNDRVPSLFNGGMDKISPVWWGFCLGLTAAIDLYGVQRARTEQDYTPGDLGFDPLGFYPPKEDEEGRFDMRVKEIKHGRLAMIAIVAFAVQEFVTKVGVVDETPFFFKPLSETVRPVLESAIQ